MNPKVYAPHYSVEYLAFLAKKKAAAEKERAEAEAEENEDDDQMEDDDDQGKKARKRARRSESVEDAEVAKPKFIAPPPLWEAFRRDLGMNPKA